MYLSRRNHTTGDKPTPSRILEERNSIMGIFAKLFMEKAREESNFITPIIPRDVPVEIPEYKVLFSFASDVPEARVIADKIQVGNGGNLSLFYKDTLVGFFPEDKWRGVYRISMPTAIISGEE